MVGCYSIGLASVRIEVFAERDGFLDSGDLVMKLGQVGEVLE
jgi:hypothetical protein